MLASSVYTMAREKRRGNRGGYDGRVNVRGRKREEGEEAREEGKTHRHRSNNQIVLHQARASTRR
jgi:hypothetical protein